MSDDIPTKILPETDGWDTEALEHPKIQRLHWLFIGTGIFCAVVIAGCGGVLLCNEPFNNWGVLDYGDNSKSSANENDGVTRNIDSKNSETLLSPYWKYVTAKRLRIEFSTNFVAPHGEISGGRTDLAILKQKRTDNDIGMTYDKGIRLSRWFTDESENYSCDGGTIGALAAVGLESKYPIFLRLEAECGLFAGNITKEDDEGNIKGVIGFAVLPYLVFGIEPGIHIASTVTIGVIINYAISPGWPLFINDGTTGYLSIGGFGGGIKIGIQI